MADTVKLPGEATADFPEGFKMTELGPLPEEWEVVRLGDVVKTIKGRKPAKIIEERLPSSLPYLTADYFRSGVPKEYVPLEDAQTIPTCSSADVVLIWDGSKAGQVFSGLEGVLASTMVRLDPFPELLDRSFLYFFLLTQFEKLNSTTTGSTVPHVNKTIFRGLPIPLPPLPEQRAIAYVLLCVQHAKEATKKIIAAARELKKSLMRYLFTYGPVPVEEAERVPLKETEIGPLPAHWQVVRLGKVFDIQQGKALSRKKDQGIRPRPFLRTANVHWGYIDLSTLDFMDFTPEEERKYALQEGDLLVCEGGDIGRSAIWENEVSGIYYQNHLHRLRRKTENVEPRFYMYWLQAALTLLGLYRGTGNKTTIPNLSRTRLGAFAIPLPPLPEQQEIARILQAVDRRIQAEEQHKQALETLFKTLLHDLMTAKRRLPGEFVAQFAKEQEGRP